MSLIGLAFAVAATVLAFRRDFKEAAQRVRGGDRFGAAGDARRSVAAAATRSLRCSGRRDGDRSYRRVFDIERRIYRVDDSSPESGRSTCPRCRLLPRDALVVVIGGRLPIIDIALQDPALVRRVIAVPAGRRALLERDQVEGRCVPCQRTALSHVRADFAPHRGMVPAPGAGARWYPRMISCCSRTDRRHAARLRYTGPGAVLIACEHERSTRALENGSRGLGRPGRRPAVTDSTRVGPPPGPTRAGDHTRSRRAVCWSLAQPLES